MGKEKEGKPVVQTRVFPNELTWSIKDLLHPEYWVRRVAHEGRNRREALCTWVLCKTKKSRFTWVAVLGGSKCPLTLAILPSHHTSLLQPKLPAPFTVVTWKELERGRDGWPAVELLPALHKDLDSPQPWRGRKINEKRPPMCLRSWEFGQFWSQEHNVTS